LVMELDRIRKSLNAPSPESPAPGNLVPAAVLLPLLQKEAQVQILFTKRTQTVRAHKGQISFPGGVRDEGDDTLLFTALREAYEEIGLQPQDVEIIGSLKPVETITSGFLIHPFVGLIPYPYPFQPNGREVAEILMVPVAFLSDPGKWHRRCFDSKHGTREAHCISYGDHLIWGATARILKIFFQQNGIDVRTDSGPASLKDKNA
jgi:8-oxo-dGTP pyrophosphatase MutT (NUDIX family)